MSDDPILEVLDDILENGSKLPPKVSNRLLLAASLKGIRAAARTESRCEELAGIVGKNTTRIWVIIAVVAILASMLGAHIGGVKIPLILP